jgi:hypothetical protein
MFTIQQRIGPRVIVGGIIFLLSVAAHASVLDPGDSISVHFAPEPRGAHLLAITNFHFPAESVFSGKLTSKVWADDESNPFGGLTFSYRLVNTGKCDDALGWFSLRGFADLCVDVNYFAGGVAPRKATRSESGAVVSFGFFDCHGDETLEPGSSSAWLIIQTSGHAWGLLQAAGVGNEMVSVATFVPVVVPEPTVAVLVALAGVWKLARRPPRS